MRDGNDADSLRRDPLFKLATDRLPEHGDLCSQSTVSRTENLPAHHHEYGFQPIVVFDGEGRMIAALLHPACRPSGRQIVFWLRRLIAALRDTRPRVEILLRADSHYCTPEVLRLCRAERLDYVVGAAPTTTLRKHIEERWQIELLFKWLKQNLRIGRFMGTGENAVRIQIATALTDNRAPARSATTIANHPKPPAQLPAMQTVSRAAVGLSRASTPVFQAWR